MATKTFADLKEAVLEKEVLVHAEKQTRIEVADVVSAIEDVEAALALGANAEELRRKIGSVTRMEGIREKVVQFARQIRPEL